MDASCVTPSSLWTLPTPPAGPVNTILYVELLEAQCMFNAFAHCYISYIMYSFIGRRRSLSRLKRDAPPKKVRGSGTGRGWVIIHVTKLGTSERCRWRTVGIRRRSWAVAESAREFLAISILFPLSRYLLPFTPSLLLFSPPPQMLAIACLGVVLYGVFWTVLWKYAVAHNSFRYLSSLPATFLPSTSCARNL